MTTLSRHLPRSFSPSFSPFPQPSISRNNVLCPISFQVRLSLNAFGPISVQVPPSLNASRPISVQVPRSLNIFRPISVQVPDSLNVFYPISLQLTPSRQVPSPVPLRRISIVIIGCSGRRNISGKSLLSSSAGVATPPANSPPPKVWELNTLYSTVSQAAFGFVALKLIFSRMKLGKLDLFVYLGTITMGISVYLNYHGYSDLAKYVLTFACAALATWNADSELKPFHLFTLFGIGASIFCLCWTAGSIHEKMTTSTLYFSYGALPTLLQALYKSLGTNSSESKTQTGTETETSKLRFEVDEIKKVLKEKVEEMKEDLGEMKEDLGEIKKLLKK